MALPLAICTWLWGAKYSDIYVERLHAGLRRNIKQPFRFILITEGERILPAVDGIECQWIVDPELTKIPGCFVRLRMFDPAWQKDMGLRDRIVNLDLDVVITGQLDDVFDRTESLIVLQGANAVNPCPYNNSVFMFQAGAHPELWSDFSLDAVNRIAQHDFPDDQGWFWHKVPNAAGWKCGPESGVYALHKPGWPAGNRLPKDARLVAFPGRRDPSMYMHLDWVRKHWRA